MKIYIIIVQAARDISVPEAVFLTKEEADVYLENSNYPQMLWIDEVTIKEY